MKTITPKDLEHAAKDLARSERGFTALRDLLAFLENAGLCLDCQNKDHVITLLSGGWGGYAGSTREIMSKALEANARPAICAENHRPD